MEQLKKKIKNKEVILFVGSGVSRNVGLPDFSELIDAMAKNVGIDKDLFALYGTFWALAEYYYLEKNESLRLFKNRLKLLWDTKEINKRIRLSNIYKLIVRLDFKLIYTTNYDECLEKAYKYNNRKCNKISTLNDLTQIKPSLTQIIKYHGDINSKKDDWVLTETSYFERMDFEHPLDIKFRADSLATPILFLGYSLADINVRYLLYKLTRSWDGHKKPKSYIFLTSPNIVQEKILKNWGITPIIAPIGASPGESLENFLEDLASD